LADAVYDKRSALLLCIVMGNLPDLDFIPGLLLGKLNAFHHGWTHSFVGVSLMVIPVLLVWKFFDRSIGIREAIGALVIANCHPLMDWLCADESPPYGMPLFWPFSDAYHLAGPSLFLPIHKSSWRDLFLASNYLAVLVEVLWFAPVIYLVAYLKKRQT
jgi:inner membrane protein